MKPQPEEWEERYFEKYGGLITHPLANGLKHFIASELSKARESERESIRRAVEKLKIKGKRYQKYEIGSTQHTCDIGYNNAIDEIVDILTSTKPEL